jgi:hypothetical protein
LKDNLEYLKIYTKPPGYQLHLPFSMCYYPICLVALSYRKTNDSLIIEKPLYVTDIYFTLSFSLCYFTSMPFYSYLIFSLLIFYQTSIVREPFLGMNLYFDFKNYIEKLFQTIKAHNFFSSVISCVSHYSCFIHSRFPIFFVR